VRWGIPFTIENDLGDAAPVAQVDENDVAQVTPAVHPSHEHSLFAGVGWAQGSAHVSASQVS
jgi:hypothetical protein